MEKLYDASLKGDVEMLEALMREDALTLARVSISSCYNQTPLHLASMLGHFKFAKSLLSYKPDFARRLDSQDRSSLHVASANGYANIVKLLLEYDPEMCRVRDEDGRTPLHLAVMNGQRESVIELIKVNSKPCNEEGTVLHLCVTYNRLNLVIGLLELNYKDLFNIKDGNGDTVLHSATALRRMQIIKYLVKSGGIQVDVNAVNQNGCTAIDIIDQVPKDVKTIEIKELLLSAGTLRAKGIKARKAKTTTPLIPVVDGVGNIDNIDDGGEAAAAANYNNISKLVKMWKKVKNFFFQDKMVKRDERLLVAASVIAAMAYQAAISPPGGVAGLDAHELALAPSPGDERLILPADSLLAVYYPKLSEMFWASNTISFMAALSVIFLYVSGATLKRRFFIWFIRAAMWITLSSMGAAYILAVLATNPQYFSNNNTLAALFYGLLAWMGLILLSFLVLVYRCLHYIVKKIIKKRATKVAVLRRYHTLSLPRKIDPSNLSGDMHT